MAAKYGKAKQTKSLVGTVLVLLNCTMSRPICLMAYFVLVIFTHTLGVEVWSFVF
jgi:hypothetical protein